MDEVSKRQLGNVSITQTGCIGLCQYEPIVEVYRPGAEKVTYINMTPEKAMEFIEELYIKCTANPWLVSTDRSHINGGYFRFAHIDIGGLNKHCQDASNELSYLCLRAMRYVKTNAPTIGVLLHQKTPDPLLYEACGLAAEGMGHPSFFNCETMYGMLRGRGAGNEGQSVYTREQILELGSPIGCVEPGVAGHQFGHTSSSFINLAECGNLALTNGVKNGKLITCDTGNATTFATFEDYYTAVKKHITCAIRQDQAGLLVAEELVAEKFALPTFTMFCRDGVKNGKDCTQGGAYMNVGATIQKLGFGTLIDSIAAVKKVVYDDKEVGIAEVRAAIEANFQGYETLRDKLMRAPKYGNNDNYADSIAVDIWSYFASEVRSLKTHLGAYADPAVQMVQANVAVGEGTRATANGRLAGTPLSDTMSATQQADIQGPTVAALSYGKMDHSVYSNGTLINMWISCSELIEKADSISS
jgi:formate C-acetyltransferase